ncbi:MAG: triphosphoribosyl-dephospho-CoA synthase CitG [Caulobacteraceae bacterium]
MSEYNQFCMHISQIAVKAMLYEVSATPKPGLVDRNNSGAHSDMDFYSFMASSSVMPVTFYRCALAGFEFRDQNMRGLLNMIRPIGIKGEKMMFSATNGANTHKGLIFSLGLISAASGYVYGKSRVLPINPEEICHTVSSMAEGITERELGHVQNIEKQTYGELLYKKYGIKGIRGEAEKGFPTVLKTGLPVLNRLTDEKLLSFNDMLVQTLLSIMAEAEDSNVIGRNGPEALEYVKASAEAVLKTGGMLTEEGKKSVYKLDDEFIKRNISPGGSADLLAITIMLYFVQKLENTEC